MRLPLKLHRKLTITKSRKGRLSSLLAAHGESVFLTADDDIVDTSGRHECILHLSGRTGG